MDFLAPYLPPPALALASTALDYFHRLLLPSARALQVSLSTRDPATLLPLAITLIALYLSLMSVYHAVRAGVRLIWWITKWSTILFCLWYALGAAQDLGFVTGGASRPAGVKGHAPYASRAARAGAEMGGAGPQRWWAEQRSAASASLTQAYRDGSPDPVLSFFKERLVTFASPPRDGRNRSGNAKRSTGGSSNKPTPKGSGASTKRAADGPNDEQAADWEALARVGKMAARSWWSIIGVGDVYSSEEETEQHAPGTKTR